MSHQSEINGTACILIDILHIYISKKLIKSRCLKLEENCKNIQGESPSQIGVGTKFSLMKHLVYQYTSGNTHKQNSKVQVSVLCKLLVYSKYYSIINDVSPYRTIIV